MTLQISELACEALKDSFAISANYFTQDLDTSARSILGYQLTLIHSFNLCYTTSTNDTHLHRTDHLLLGKAYVNSTSIQVLDSSGASATLTLKNEHYKRNAVTPATTYT
jgi:hypothetical protein